jgi:hypothetical protein
MQAHQKVVHFFSTGSSEAMGGPVARAVRTIPNVFGGINDPEGEKPHGTPFTPVIFELSKHGWATNSHRMSGFNLPRCQTLSCR